MKKNKCPHCLKQTRTQICEHCFNDTTHGDDMSDFRRELRLAIRIDDQDKLKKQTTFILSINPEDPLSTYISAYLNYVDGYKEPMIAFLGTTVLMDANEIINHALLHIEDRELVQRFIDKNWSSVGVESELSEISRLEMYEATIIALTTPHEKRVGVGKMQLILGVFLLVLLGSMSFVFSESSRYFYTNLMFIIPSVLLARGVVNRFMKVSRKFVVVGLFFLFWYVLTFLILINLQHGAWNHLIRMVSSLFEFFEFYVRKAL